MSHPRWQFLQRTAATALVIGALFLSYAGCERSPEQASPAGQSHPRPARTTANPDAAQQSFEEPAPSHSAQRQGAASTDFPRIVAFGDSLTAGLGVASEEAYPAQLQRRLDESGYQVRVINAGVSGETSAGGVRRVNWILKSRPNVVILELGGNDGLRGIDPEQTQANLDHIIRRFQEADVPIILAGMKLPPNYGQEFTARFAAMYSDLARKHRLIFIPFFLEGVATHNDLTQADGIHPTAEGYRVIVDNLLPVIKPLLAEIAERAS